MEAQAEGVKKFATVSNIPRARWGKSCLATASCTRERTRREVRVEVEVEVGAEVGGAGVGVGYAREAMPEVSLMGALPHCTK